MDAHMNGHSNNGHKPHRPKKIAIIGAGKIGTELWKELTEHRVADEIAVWNRSEDKHVTDAFKGTQRAVDQANIIHANHRSTSQFKFLVGDEGLKEAIKGADIVVVTAGAARKPGMERSDLLEVNCSAIDPIAATARDKAPNAMYIIATNPVDTITQRFYEKSGISHEQIVGLSGELDRARLTQSICNNVHIAPEQIENSVSIGMHGSETRTENGQKKTRGMVPVLSNVLIHREGGRVEHLKDYDPQVLAKIKEETINGGGILVKLLGTSDYIAPAAALAKMVHAVIDDKWHGKESGTLYASSYHPEEDLFIGQKIRISGGKFHSEGTPPLSFQEKEQWKDSVDLCREALQDLPGRERDASSQLVSRGAVR